MQRRSVFASITPISSPSPLSRETVVQSLHDHRAMIEQNPLVIHYEQCAPPADASAEESDHIWYEVTDRVTYLPGGLFHGRIRYRAGFDDTARGIQTHVYAPMRVDIRSRWSVCENVPGEPREPDLADRPDGIYLREDVDLRCPLGATTFVRKNLTRSHAVLVARLARVVSENRPGRAG